MKNVTIYADRIADAISGHTTRPQTEMKNLLLLLKAEGLDTNRNILYGYDAVRNLFWFRNDARGEMINLPLHKVKVWPDASLMGL